MIEIKHFKVKVLPSQPEPNSIYFVVADGATAVTTYVTDVCGVPLPLVDLQGSGGSGGCCNLAGTGVTGTQQNPIVNISTFLSSENGNLITLSTIDGKLYLGDNNDNKVIYFYPTLAELGVLTLEEVTETHIATWIQTQGIIIAEDEIPLFKVQLILYPIPLYPVGLVNPNIFSTSPEFTTFYATEVYPLSTDTATTGATIYADKKGTLPFQGDSNGLNYVNFWRAVSDLCWYKINPSGVVIEGTCGRT
jgi:hypothetical protein